MRILFLFIFTFLLLPKLHSQCITGPSTLAYGESGNYSIPALGQCNACYDWDIISGTASITGGDTLRNITIQATAVGTFVIKVTYFDEDGCHDCYDTVVVPTPPCDINQSGIYFVNLLGDVNLKFYTMPQGIPDNFSYEWTFTYNDLSTSWSYDKEPYIPVPCDNTIKHAYVKITSAVCIKEINKNWNPGICGTEGMSGRSAQSGTAITVSPNPTTGIVNFSGKGLEQYTVDIFDHTGKPVIQKAAITKSINISKQKSDVYIYIITGPGGFSQKGKIVKQ